MTSWAPVEDLGTAFERERPRLVGLAYRITGSRLDAEDVVQEAWIRLQRLDDPAAVARPEAWLTTVVSRLALDVLRSARHRRERYVGPWLPEPVVTGSSGPPPVEGADPARTAELAESLTFGFLTVLERLSPVDRVVFLLADVFDVPYDTIAQVVQRSPAACRQIASRARRRMRAEAPSAATPAAAPVRSVLDRLLVATAAGDIGEVVRLLSDDAVLVSDGGATTRAARHPVVGPHRIARFLVGLARKGMTELSAEPVELNAEPGWLLSARGRPFLAIVATVDADHVRALHLVRAPEKLAALSCTTPLR